MSANAVCRDWVGRVIDRKFTLLQWLGGSSRSGVFLTESPDNGVQKAVIKLIPSDTEAEDRLDGWAHATRLSHPHLVRMFHVGHCEIDGALLIYIVTEYADEVLSEILPTRALSPDEVEDLTGPILDALSYIHAQHFVHGRLKPSNIVAVGDVLKLSSDSLVAAGTPPGYGSEATIYDAPERDVGELSSASDVWSLGVTLVEAITDQPPKWDRWSNSAPIVPNTILEPFASVVRGCLELDPAHRFTIADVRKNLGSTAPALENFAELAAAFDETPVPEPAAQSETAAASEPAPKPALPEPALAKPALTDPVLPEPAHSPASKMPAVTSGKSHIRVLIIALVIIAILMFFALHKHKPQRSSDAQPSTTEETAPEAAVKPPAGIAVPRKSGSPRAASSSAPPPETPPSGSPGMGGPTIKGQVAQRVMPDVLPAAGRSIHGTIKVQVRVNVGSAGNVSNASFDFAGPSRYFSKIAMQAAQQWKFTPAEVNGQPAPSVWVLQFRFTRGGTDVTPSEANP